MSSAICFSLDPLKFCRLVMGYCTFEAIACGDATSNRCYSTIVKVFRSSDALSGCFNLFYEVNVLNENQSSWKHPILLKLQMRYFIKCKAIWEHRIFDGFRFLRSFHYNNYIKKLIHVI